MHWTRVRLLSMSTMCPKDSNAVVFALIVGLNYMQKTEAL